MAFLLRFQRSTILDYLPAETILYLDEPGLLKESQEKISIEWKAILSQTGLTEFEPELEQFVEAVTFKLSNFKQIKGEALPALSDSSADSVFNLGMQEPPPLGGNFKLLEKSLEEYKNQNYRVHLVCDSSRHKERLQEILENWADKIFWEVGNLNSGFVIPELKLVILADHQIFGRQPFRTPAKRFKQGLAISSYKTLNPGDYVVHIDYGIGKFKGLAALILDGRTRECLELTYAGEDKLYVPIEEFRLVQKFIGKEGEPTLSRLGGQPGRRLKPESRKRLRIWRKNYYSSMQNGKLSPGFPFQMTASGKRSWKPLFPIRRLRTSSEQSKRSKKTCSFPIPWTG